jgi:hypothetical protein
VSPIAPVFRVLFVLRVCFVFIGVVLLSGGLWLWCCCVVCCFVLCVCGVCVCFALLFVSVLCSVLLVSLGFEIYPRSWELIGSQGTEQIWRGADKLARGFEEARAEQILRGAGGPDTSRRCFEATRLRVALSFFGGRSLSFGVALFLLGSLSLLRVCSAAKLSPDPVGHRSRQTIARSCTPQEPPNYRQTIARSCRPQEPPNYRQTIARSCTPQEPPNYRQIL